HHVRLPGHRDGGDVAQEQDVLALELHLGKGVSREGRGEQLQQSDHDGDLGRVLDEGQQGDLGPDIDVVLPAGVGGDPLDGEAEHVLVLLKGGGQHPEEGQQHESGDDDQEEVDEKAHDRVAPFLGRVVLDSSDSHDDPPPLVFAAGAAELDDGDDQHQYEQDHGDGAGIAVLGGVDKSHVVNVVHQGHGRIAGAALGDHVHLVVHLEARDGQHDDDEEGGGAQLGQGDVPELLPAVGAVQLGGLVQVRVAALQAGQVDDHVVAHVLP